MHLYENDVTDWFAATSIEQAKELAIAYYSDVGQCGPLDLDEIMERVDALEQTPDDRELEMNFEDLTPPKQTKTAAEWAASAKPGFFASTEY